MESNELKITLPNGLVFRAVGSPDDNYPGVNIFLDMPGGKSDLICFAEYNPGKHSGEEICIGAYNAIKDDTDYYESYRWNDSIEE